MRLFKWSAPVILLASGVAVAAPTNVTVTVTNLAPANGTVLSPVWVGFHDGTFDLFTVGQPASAGLEQMAEDADGSGLLTEFAAASGANQGLISGPDPLPGGATPIGPGVTVSRTFTVDSTDPSARYFSFAHAVLPGNDAFFGNDNPTSLEIFDAGGAGLSLDILVEGSQVLEAGTEVDDEVPANTAFAGQTTPGTGVDQNSVVALHPGYFGSDRKPEFTAIVLANPLYAAADFTAAGYDVARLTVTTSPAGPVPAPIPLPPAALAGGALLGALGVARRFRRR